MAWADIGMNAGGRDYLKLADKEKVRLHVIGESLGGPAEPKSVYQYFNNTINRGIVVGDDYVGTVDKRASHSFVVWSFRDEALKVWQMGNKLCEVIKGIYDGYDGSLDGVDIILQRSGTGKQTKYIPTAVPTKFDASVIEGLPIPDLEELLAPGTQEDIDNLIAGIVPDGDGASAAAADTTSEVATEPEPGVTEEATTEETVAEEPAAEEVDEEAALMAQLAAAKAKKAAAAKANGAKPAGATATLVRPKPGVAKPGVAVGDPRIAKVKSITQKFATNKKYATPAARMAVIKSVAAGKSTLSQLSVAELSILEKKLSK